MFRRGGTLSPPSILNVWCDKEGYDIRWDGWMAAVISDTFTFENVRLVSQAIADYVWANAQREHRRLWWVSIRASFPIATRAKWRG
jgi:hypothetical protein